MHLQNVDRTIYVITKLTNSTWGGSYSITADLVLMDAIQIPYLMNWLVNYLVNLVYSS